jgi:hypothetical protein
MSDIARNMTPGRFNSLEEVANAAPVRDSDELEPGVERELEKKHRGRPKGSKNAPKQTVASDEAKKALEKATLIRCKRLAATPFSLWAAIAQDPDLKLSAEETESLQQAWFATFVAMGWTGEASKLWCWLELSTTYAALVAVRSKTIQAMLTPQPPQEPIEDPNLSRWTS